jgi:hypothetical protein
LPAPHHSAAMSRWATFSLVLLLCLSPGAVDLTSEPPASVAPCVPCHSRPGSDQVGEWLASPYSQAEGGRGCVGCHGSRCSGIRDRKAPSAGAPGRLTVTAVCSGEAVEAEVVLANLGAGHDLPSASPHRTLLLEVSARREDGLSLSNLGAQRSRIQLSRLAPFATDVSRHRFVSAGRHAAHITARLLLSRSGILSEIDSTTTRCRVSGATP